MKEGEKIMDKIKVCHIVKLNMCGVGIFVCNLLEHTDYKKYDATVLICGDEYSGILLSRLKKLPTKVVHCHSNNSLEYFKFLTKFFKEQKFDVCHSHISELSGLFLFIAYCSRIQTRVAHSHVAPKPLKHTFFSKNRSLWRSLRTIVMQAVLFHLVSIFSNRRLACSEEAAIYLFKNSIIRKKKYVIIPNGIALNEFSCPQKTIRKKTEILFIGRMFTEKNPLFAIQVFAEYLKEDPTAHMTMIGKGLLEADVRAEIESLNLFDHINIVSETGDAPQYYRAADLLLFPSFHEGLGTVLVEAQAAKVKCLASDAVPQLAQCGLVEYKPLADGPEAWAKYISQLLQDDCLKVDQEKLKYFDIKNTVRMIDEAYARSV